MSVAKGLKLKVRKFWGLIRAIVEVTGEKLVGRAFLLPQCLKNVIHQIDSKNEWLLLPARFTAKFGLVFVLTLENSFS